jgi:hypothetical protein
VKNWKWQKRAAREKKGGNAGEAENLEKSKARPTNKYGIIETAASIEFQ